MARCFSRETTAAILIALLACISARAEGIHGGTAPSNHPEFPSQRGTMPSFRGETPSLKSGDQFERWFTPSMPVPTFPNNWLPSRPGFTDAGGAAGWYDPANKPVRSEARGPLGWLPSAFEEVSPDRDTQPPIYLELPDRAGGPRRLPAAIPAR